MTEKRKSKRIETTIQLKGKLYHVVDFKVKNISIGGINILCNFQPRVGSLYTIFLIDNGVTQDFEVLVLRCEIVSQDDEKKIINETNILLSIGARFINLNTERRHFLDSFLKRSGEQDIGFLAEPENEKKNPRSLKKRP